MNLNKFLVGLLFLFSCQSPLPPDVSGCMDIEACNYNKLATLDDSSCSYSEINYDCDGDCILQIDCADVCGGNSYNDNCGVCDSDPLNDCANDCLGVPGGGALRDCAGLCQGTAFKDCGNQCCVEGYVFNSDGIACLDKDGCGICDAEGFSDVYPRLDDCDDQCSETTKYYRFSGDPGQIRSCTDLKVLQDLIDINILNGNLDIYNTLMDDSGNKNGIIEVFELGLAGLDGFGNPVAGQEWNQQGNLIKLKLTVPLELPESIGNLSSLKSLVLIDNQLTSIPESIGDLISLEELEISSSQISGLPDKFDNLLNLIELKLNNNLISELPYSFGSLIKLQVLHLYHNQISAVPENIGNLVELKELLLNDNKINILPESISDLNNLEILRLHNNNLITLPTSMELVGSLSSLKELWLNNNSLISLPPDIFVIDEYSGAINLGNLESLWLNYNQLQIIPENIGNLPYLESLKLDHNQLGEFGSVPESICNYFDPLTGQSKIYFTIDNNLECPIYPECIDIMLGYQRCDDHCESGYLIGSGGMEPNEGCLNYNDWNVLIDFISEYNAFNNLLPVDIVDEIHWVVDSNNEHRLVELDMHNINPKLKGSIPNSIGFLDKLEKIDMSNNELNGSIPLSIGNLLSLKEIKLSYNELDGTIPSEVINLPQLRTLYLYGNNLNGELPEFSDNLLIEELKLYNNNLSGDIPSSIGSLNNLIQVNLDKNSFTGEIPNSLLLINDLTIIKLSHNQISGSLSDQICNINRVFLHDNNLTGSIPECVCDMIYISLSNNSFCNDSPSCIDIGQQNCSP